MIRYLPNETKRKNIRVEAYANTTERTVVTPTGMFMKTRVQLYGTEVRTNDTSCPSRTSAEHFD